MGHFTQRAIALLPLLTSPACAQFFGGGPYSGYGGSIGSGSPFSGGYGPPDNSPDDGPGFFNSSNFFNHRVTIVIIHSVFGALAVAFILPIGGIFIRLAVFPGAWIVYALIQLVGYFAYIISFGLGIWISRNLYTFDQAHVILGIIILALILFQPILGLIHHFHWKRHGRRGASSMLHIWLGRIVITLGIINGGLGLQLAQQLDFLPPSTAQIIAYSVVARVIWILYVSAIFIGERNRRGPPRVTRYVDSAGSSSYLSHTEHRRDSRPKSAYSRTRESRHF